jgi:hypothetical protein
MRADERENSAGNRDWRSSEQEEEEKQSVSFPGMKKNKNILQFMMIDHYVAFFLLLHLIVVVLL